MLAAVLLGSICAGCAKQEPETPTAQNEVKNSEPYNGEMPISDEPVKLKFMTHSGFAANMPEPSNDLLFYQKLQERTNVEIEWEVITTDAYNEVLQARLSAGVDLPDIMNLYVTSNLLNSYDRGLFLQMDDLIEQYGYYTKQWFADGNEMYRELWTMADGHIYALQDYVLPTYNQVVPMYNTEWLKKLGREVPQTLEEFEALCYAMKGVDFNGNGKDDEIILSGNLQNFNTLGNSFGLEIHDGAYGFQTDDGETVTCDYVNDRYREFLEFSAKLYRDGILDREVTLNTSTMMMEKVAADRVGIVINWAEFAPVYSKLTSYGVENPDAEVYTVGVPLKGPYGDQYMIQRNIPGGDPCVITRECSNPEVAMKWLDYVFGSEECITLRYFGIEGTDYTVNDAGEKTIIQPEDGTTFNEHIYSYGGGQVPFCHQQSLEISYATDPEWLVAANQNLQPYFKMGLIETAWNEEEKEIYSTYWPDLQSRISEMQGLFISGQKELNDETWKSYTEELEAMHLNDLIGIYQSRYTRNNKK